MIVYNKDSLNVVNHLSQITKKRDEKNAAIRFFKDEEGVHVRAGNEGRTIVFTVDLPSEVLDFEGEELCFFDFPEFNKYLNTFDAPILEKVEINEGDNEAISITQGRRKIVYPLSDSEVLGSPLKPIKWGEPSTTFELSADNVGTIKNILGLLGAKDTNLVFSFSGSEVTVNTASANKNKSVNSFEDVYSLATEVEEEFVVTIKSDVFKYLGGTDYKVEVNSLGILRLYYEVSSVKASILITGEDE